MDSRFVGLQVVSDHTDSGDAEADQDYYLSSNRRGLAGSDDTTTQNETKLRRTQSAEHPSYHPPLADDDDDTQEETQPSSTTEDRDHATGARHGEAYRANASKSSGSSHGTIASSDTLPATIGHLLVLHSISEDFFVQCNELFAASVLTVNAKLNKETTEGIAKLRRSVGALAESVNATPSGDGTTRPRKAADRREILQRQLSSTLLDDQHDIRDDVLNAIQASGSLMETLRKSTHLVRKTPTSATFTEFVPPSSLGHDAELDALTSALLTAKEMITTQKDKLKELESVASRIPTIHKGVQSSYAIGASVAVQLSSITDASSVDNEGQREGTTTSTAATADAPVQIHVDPAHGQTTVPPPPPGSETLIGDCGPPGITSLRITPKTGSTRSLGSAGPGSRRGSQHNGVGLEDDRASVVSKKSAASVSPSVASKQVKTLNANSRLLAPTQSSARNRRGSTADGGADDAASVAGSIAPSPGGGVGRRPSVFASRRQSVVSIVGESSSMNSSVTQAQGAMASGSPPGGLASKKKSDGQRDVDTASVSSGVTTTGGGGPAKKTSNVTLSVEVEAFEAVIERLETLIVTLVQRWTKALVIGTTAAAEVTYLRNAKAGEMLSLSSASSQAHDHPSPKKTRSNVKTTAVRSSAPALTGSGTTTPSSASALALRMQNEGLEMQVKSLAELIETLEAKLTRSEIRNAKLRKWAEREHSIALSAERRAESANTDLLNCLSHFADEEVLCAAVSGTAPGDAVERERTCSPALLDPSLTRLSGSASPDARVPLSVGGNTQASPKRSGVGSAPKAPSAASPQRRLGGLVSSSSSSSPLPRAGGGVVGAPTYSPNRPSLRVKPKERLGETAPGTTVQRR